MNSRPRLTLSIEPDSVRLLTTGYGHVEGWKQAPLAPGATSEGMLDPESVRAALRAVLKGVDFAGRRVSVSFSGLTSLFRTVTLPKMRGSLMPEAVYWAARREMPVPMEELVLYWRVVGHDAEEEHVFMVGTPRRAAAALVQRLADAGVEPDVIDLKPLALARLAPRTKHCIVADLEGACTLVMVLSSGVPQVVLAVPASPALLVDERVQGLVEALSRVNAYHDRTGAAPLASTTPLMLTGELAADPALVELVGRETALAVCSPPPQLSALPDLPLARYAANIGMAMRGVVRGGAMEMNVNLLALLKRKSWPPRRELK